MDLMDYTQVMKQRLWLEPVGSMIRPSLVARLCRAEWRLAKAIEAYEWATADEDDFCEVCEYERCKCDDKA